MSMKITADNFRKKPAEAYRRAEKGETITINHDRYPDVVFELKARKRYKGLPCASAAHELNSKTIEELIGGEDD